MEIWHKSQPVSQLGDWAIFLVTSIFMNKKVLVFTPTTRQTAYSNELKIGV